MAATTQIRFTRIAMALTLAAFAYLAAGAVRAEASAPVYSFDTIPSTTQAGGHPDIEIGFQVANRASQGFNDPCFCNDPKNVTVHLPAGVIGNPHVTPRCTTAQFAQRECPRDSQVGIVYTLLYGPLADDGRNQYMELYNMLPTSEQAGLLGFINPFSSTPTYIELSARTGGDYGLDATTIGIEKLIPIFEVRQWLWGVPAAEVHDPLRGAFGSCELSEVLPFLKKGTPPPAGYCYQNPEPKGSNSPELPFMSNPTTCSGPLTSMIDTLAYDHGTAHSETTYGTITGCDQLSFNPSLSAKPTTTQTDTASGLDIDLSVPQLQSPTTPSPSQIKATTVTLPEGFSINPNAADGKVSCSDEQGRLRTDKEAQCPEYSKVGTVTLESSALPAPISGYIYLGDPLPEERFRLILTADGFATHVKLTGTVATDPETGRVTTSFKNLPQSPLTQFRMHFFGSERGLLATPTRCGTYAVNSTFVPWDGALAEQTATQFFALDSGPTAAPCPGRQRPFAPSFAAASVSNAAGAHTPFVLTASRGDGDQGLSGVRVETPPGFSATLRGIPYCAESAIAGISSPSHTGAAELEAPACPAASQVGTAVAGVGAGTHPLYNPGKVYLAGPYRDGPLSLVIVVPAVSGPYDLGNVAVRAAIHVDPTTAQVTTISDPLPRILEGVPLRIRSIRVDLNRPEFTLNPTNCDPMSVNGLLSGEEGGMAERHTHFQAANCAVLPFAPALRLRLSGGVQRLGHPAIHAVLTAGAGHANLRGASVTLPKGALLDNSHIDTICTRVQYAARTCPEGSRIGEAKAITPLLDGPLKGSVYLRSSSNKLPDMVVDLRGQVDFTAVARIDSVGGRLRTTFDAVPDVPLGTFILDLKGGAKGLLQNSESLCGKAKKATVRMTAQNGAVVVSKNRLQTACGSQSRHKRHLDQAGRADG